MKGAASKRAYTIYSAIILIFLFTGSLLMGVYTPRITNRGPGEDIVIGSDVRAKTEELYYSGLWLSENNAGGNKILGDITVFETFSGFFKFDVNSYQSSLKELYLGSEDDILDMIYWNKFEFGGYKHTLHYDKLDYFVINNAFSRYPSVVFGSPIFLDNARLDGITVLDKVYNNDEIQIYKIQRRN